MTFGELEKMKNGPQMTAEEAEHLTRTAMAAAEAAARTEEATAPVKKRGRPRKQRQPDEHTD